MPHYNFNNFISIIILHLIFTFSFAAGGNWMSVFFLFLNSVTKQSRYFRFVLRFFLSTKSSPLIFSSSNLTTTLLSIPSWAYLVSTLHVTVITTIVLYDVCVHITIVR